MTAVAGIIQQKKNFSISKYNSRSESSTAAAWHLFGHGTNTKYSILLHF